MRWLVAFRNGPLALGCWTFTEVQGEETFLDAIALCIEEQRAPGGWEFVHAVPWPEWAEGLEMDAVAGRYGEKFGLELFVDGRLSGATAEA